ncbi:unnamed protein product [Prorocentrum cordatum]|uniref:Uncharacterized protein n=1 Tax=Prorocentrum cordatum TaxID=2364126 RepID=A0ABN9YFM9_9DINO|nr:unnamed protein product [Polarella glacialis]
MHVNDTRAAISHSARARGRFIEKDAKRRSIEKQKGMENAEEDKEEEKKQAGKKEERGGREEGADQEGRERGNGGKGRKRRVRVRIHAWRASSRRRNPSCSRGLDLPRCDVKIHSECRLDEEEAA